MTPDELRDELEKLHFLWDGSEEWVLSVFYHSEVDLKIVFEANQPSIREVMALRKLLETYRDIPVQKLKEIIGTGKELSIEKRSTFEARPLLQRARELGINLVQTDASSKTYLPIHQINQAAFIIEDDELLKQVAQRMLATGVPVVEQIEVD